MNTAEIVREQLSKSTTIPPGEHEYAVKFVDDLARIHGFLVSAGMPVFDTVHVCLLPEHDRVGLPLALVEDMFSAMGVTAETGETLRQLRSYEGTKTLRFLFITPVGLTVLVIQPQGTELPKVNCTTVGHA